MVINMINKVAVLYRKYREIINYLIVGVCTTLVSLGTYYGLVLTVLDPKDPVKLQAANIISWVAAVTFAYFTNRIFVAKLIVQVIVTIANYVISKFFVFQKK